MMQPDQWQIDDNIPVFDGYYGLTITDHVGEMMALRMTAHEYAARLAHEWAEMAGTCVSHDLIEQLADDLESHVGHLMSSAGLV